MLNSLGKFVELLRSHPILQMGNFAVAEPDTQCLLLCVLQHAVAHRARGFDHLQIRVFSIFLQGMRWKCLPVLAQMFKEVWYQPVRTRGAEQEGKGGALWNDSQNNWASRPVVSWQELTNPEVNLMILVQKRGWWIWIWTFPLFPIHIPLELKNDNEQPGKSFLQLSGDCVTKSDGSNLTFPSHKASVYWHKFIVSSFLRVY